MELKIYSNDGKVKLTVEPRESSTQTEEIQTGDVLTVSFTLPRRVSLEVNDYTDFMGRRYWLTERYRPVQKSTMEWEYSMKFYGLENLISRFLVLNTTDGGNEAVFTLTAPPREHVALIVKSINAGFGTNDWKVGSVEGGDNIVVDYHGKYCDEGLKALAEATGTEYWIEGTTVNLCRCEHGERVTLGYQNGLTKIQPDVADNAKVYSRLFPTGSSKNIDPAKYGHSRLQLPGGAQYVDINTDKYGIIHHYEENAFAGIFPRYTGTVCSVRSEERTNDDGDKYTVYYFKDDALPFDPNQYEIGRLVKRVSFQEGSELAGLGNEDAGTYYFEANFNSGTWEFEIITQFNDSDQLPGGVLVPKAGDRYIPWNIRMPDEYYALAEAEFLDAVHEYNSRHSVDVSCFKAPTDYIEIEKRKLELHVGRRVRLESAEYFPERGYKDSRITKITHKINRPSQMDLEISDALSTGALDRIQGNIDEVKTNLQLVRGNLPDIIRTGDCTPFTDNNLLSASRTRHDFLSKLKDDRAKGKIASDMGFEIGNYLAGVSGGMFGIDKTDGQSFADVFKLYVHGKAYFETLTIIEANTLAGKHYITPGGAIKCSKVEEVKNETGAVTAYRCYFLSEQDGEKTETKIVAGDQAISEMFNAKTGMTNKVSNHRYWRLVTAVNNDAYTDESGNHYGYVELSATDCESDSDIPQKGDVIDQLGNRTDKTRQAAMIFSTVDPDAPSIKLLTGIDHYTLTGKDIISQGYDPVKGHAFFNCYGDVFIGDKDGSTYIKYDQDTKSLLAKLKLTIDSTIDGKTLNDYFSGLIPELTQEDIEDFVNNIISPKLDGIQNQIDGVVESFFDFGAPTLNNYPANEWTTDELRKAHANDTYTDKTEYVDDVTTPTAGRSWRWQYTSPTDYGWVKIADSDAVKALLDAAKAQDTADGKRRVFTSQPVPPYDKGDLWVNATYPAGTTALTRDPSTGKYYLDILRCGSAKAAGGSFAIGDWGLASNYTDDTLAQAAKKAADAAQKAADDAQTDADEAKDRLDGWAADNVISPTEKQAIKDEIARIDGDKAHIEAEYTRYSLGAPTVYTAAYTAYRAQLVALSASTPENIAIPADFALNQTAYYTQRTGALTAIAAAAKKYAEDVAKDEANKAIAGLEYLKEAMVNGASQAIGGLFLSSHIRLGQWDKSDPTNPVLSKTYAGLNGLIPDSLTYKGSAIAAWYGGEMEDLFSYNAITGKYDLLTTLSPTKRYAASLFRMDGSMYLAKGNMFVQPDGFTQWGKGSSAVTISPDGVVSLGNGIKINIGGDVQGLADALSSLLTIVNGINNVLYPIDVAGNRLNWSAPVESIHAIKAVKGFFSTEFISALGLVQGNLGGGSGTGGSLFGLMREWPSVDPGPSTQEALGANLGWELRNRIAALETAGYATQNWVLNKNYLTSHQDISHLLSKTEAASLYQPKGNYLTSHQSLSHLLNKNEGMYFLKNSQDAYIGARFYNADLARVAAAKYIELWQSGYGWFNLQAGKFITHGGTSAQFVKGDGSLDGNNYALASALTDGSVTKVGTATVGASNWPIYLNNGVPYACAWKFGNYNGAAAVNNGTLNENLNADMLDGLHVGEAPGRVARFSGFPAYSSFGYEGTADETYFSYLLKKLATDNSGEIMAVGRAHPNSQGVFIMHGYSGRKNGYPQYGSGLYVGIDGRVVPIRIQDGIYTYGHGIFDGNAASASRLQTTGTYTAWGQTYFANGVPQSVSGNLMGVANIEASGVIRGGVMELYEASPWIDFHFGKSTADFTSRIIECASGQLSINNALFVTYSGNVGIGTASPAYKLDVNGTARVTALRIGDILIEEDKANGGVKISGGVYATKYVSALGLATGNLSGGGTTGGTAYDRLDAWADYTTDKAGYVLSAALGTDLNSRVGANATSINSILSRLNSLEGGGTTSVTVTGSGNAITDISKGGTAIIATKGATFALASELGNYQPKGNYLTSHQSLSHLLRIDGSNGTAAGVSTLIGKLADATADVLDSTKFVTSDNTGDVTSKLYYRRPATALWNYIKGKADAVYQPKGSYFTNQGHLTNKDFDTIVNSGAGYIDATSTNKPPTVSYGQLLTLHGSGDTIAQMAFDYADSGNLWVRSGNPTNVGGQGSWKPWVQMLTATNYASTLDTRYVKKAGDTMTGELNIQMNSHKLRLYHDNYTRIQSDVEFVFDKRTWANGTSPNVNNTYSCGEPSYRWSNVYATTINVTSTGLVSNLNADMLDGKHDKDFIRNYIYPTGTTFDANTGLVAYQNSVVHEYRWANTPRNSIASLFDFCYSPDWRSQLFIIPGSKTTIHARSFFGGTTWGDWRELAFTDSNVASATKLQTARTLWGQSFDGSANVSGDLTNVGEIIMSNGIVSGGRTDGVYLGTSKAALGSTATGGIMLAYGANPLYFYTNSLQRMKITGDGRIGINNDSPAYTLDVTGTGRFTSDLTALTVYSSNWFRSTGNSGWYSQTYGGGIYMTDVNWVRAYNNKGFRVQEGVGIGANSFIVGLKLHGASHEALEVSAGNYSMGLGCHNNGSWYWWRGTANPEGSGNKSYVMQYDGSVWKFTGQLRCDSLRIGDAVFTYDAAHNGIKLDKGLYSEGYLSALGLSELTNTKFTINAGYESDALTILGGGITRSGYSGDVWNKGYGALNVAIDTSAGDSKQTPLLLAFSAGATNLDVSTSRLFALELLNNGNTLDFKLAGEVKLSINKIGLSAWSATLNYINATSIGTATVTATGKITCQSLTQTSDMRLKNVVRPMDLSVEAIAKAPSFIHQWKRDGAFDLGSSAQYWAEMSPLFTPRDKDGFLTMQYGKAALLSAIAIARRTVSHEERIRNLESENKKLRAELNGLKARLRA